MHLKSLELAGFKSFARKVTLDFTSSITAIVGPNGSGKSNVAEGFQFVLGEQSIKSLRGKRGEDLIWNGAGDASGASRANRAAVKVTFDNSGKIFPNIDFDEVSVERVVHRDNTNEYILNGSQVRLKDIVETLAAAHVGATGHHIISQGEADRILTASIRERREMIEDALGLKIYQWKKAESIRKLERTDENMKQVASLRREIAPHLKFLKKQVEKSEKAEEMRRELISLYQTYLADEEFYIKKEKDRLSLDLAGPRKELSELDRDLERARNILLASKSKDKKSDQVINLEKELAASRMEKEAVMRELGRIEGETGARKRSIEKEESRIKNEETRTVYLKDVEEVIERAGVIGAREFNAVTEARKMLEDIVGALREFVAKHRSVSDQASIGEARKELTVLEKEQDHLEGKLENLAEKEARQNREYLALKEHIEKEKDTDGEAEKDVFKIIARQNEVRGILSGLNGQLNTVISDEDAFKRELGDAGIVAGRQATEYEQSLKQVFRGEQASRLKQIEKIKIRLEDAGGSGGMEVMKEYKETEERDTFLGKELEDLDKARQELLKLIRELDVRVDFEFKNGILKINDQFQKFFALMFGGGKAELSVVREARRKRRSELEDLNTVLGDNVMIGTNDNGPDSDDQSEDSPEGLEVNVILPRKKVKGLVMLSGGERALTSIALLFAISQVNPPPFIILDETDAALDEANSKKYGDMIEKLSEKSQLILITHNRETMSRAGVLYGITMGSDGASRLLSIAFEEAVKVAK